MPPKELADSSTFLTGSSVYTTLLSPTTKNLCFRVDGSSQKNHQIWSVSGEVCKAITNTIFFSILHTYRLYGISKMSVSVASTTKNVRLTSGDYFMSLCSLELYACKVNSSVLPALYFFFVLES